MKDEETGMNNKMNGLVKVILFSMVGIILITSFALPIFSSIISMERQVNEWNDGVRVDTIDFEKAKQIAGEPIGNSVSLILDSEGINLQYYSTTDHTTKQTLLASIDSLNTDYPVAFQIPPYDASINNLSSMAIATFSAPNYTYASADSILTYHTITITVKSAYIDASVYYQSPNGNQMLTEGSINDTDGEVIGFDVVYDDFGLRVISDVADCLHKVYTPSIDDYVWTRDSTTPNISTETITTAYGAYQHISGISATVDGKTYNCKYFIGDLYVTESEKNLTGTLSSLIGIIPILLIIGIVMYVVRNMNISDR